MTWPSAATKDHLDAGGDDPKQARGELVTLVDTVNSIISHVSSFMQAFIDDTDAATARSTLDAQQAIDSLTAETSPAIADTLGFYDASATAYRKITFSNWLKVINGLSEDTSPDGANDFLVIYDASAGRANKVKPDNLGGVFTESFTSAEQTITSAGSLSLAHGLAGKPHIVQLRLVCKTGELGYSVGDEVVIDPHAMDVGGNNRGTSVVPTVTTIDIRFGIDGTVYPLIRKDTGAVGAATNGNWRLVVRAWR